MWFISKISANKASLKKEEIMSEKLKPEFDAGLDNDLVNHPKHYLAASVSVEYEPIDITRYYSFDIGNAIKYILRAPYKGHEKLDFEKARFYLKDWLDHHTASNNSNNFELNKAETKEDEADLVVAARAYRKSNKYIAKLLSDKYDVWDWEIRECISMVDKRIEELNNSTGV